MFTVYCLLLPTSSCTGTEYVWPIKQAHIQYSMQYIVGPQKGVFWLFTLINHRVIIYMGIFCKLGLSMNDQAN